MSETKLTPRSRFACAVLLLACGLQAEPEPGAVFREYVWKPPRDRWQRVTGPDATHTGARQFLPNPVNTINLIDLQGATRLEVQIERLVSHTGTVSPRMRVNKNGWIHVPEPSSKYVPGTRGSGGTPNLYCAMHYPIVNVPLNQVRQGNNTFEFTCQGAGGRMIGRLWPQWLVYGVTFRVYYNSSKARPDGAITSPTPGSFLSDNPTFTATPKNPNNIRQIDFVGDYDDFNWRGDGEDGRWQYHFKYGVIQRHIGTATSAPWRVSWNTKWIPTQPKPFRVYARIVDKSGLVYITPAVGGLILRRNETVIRYRSTKVPIQWQSRQTQERKQCETNVTHDLSKAREARLFLATWNGYESQDIGVNNKRVATSIGKNHDLDYNQIGVPLGHLRRGTNVMHTYSRTTHHGIEVQWPGIELFVRYGFSERWASYETFGSGCRGSRGMPGLAATGRPVLGGSFTIRTWNGRPQSPLALISGLSDQNWGTTKLPLDLARIGGTGCKLYTEPTVARAAVADAAGTQSFKLGVPSAPALLGIRWFNQAVWRDPSANALGWVLSNAARGTVGER